MEAAGGARATPSWYLSREEIERGSPSRRDGVGAAKEAELRATYCSFLRDVGIRLELPQVTIATAIVLCHRFYLRQSHAKNEWQMEDTPRSLRRVVVVAYETMYQKNPDAAERINQKEVLEKQKALILVGETLLLSTIRFDFNIQHPYEPLKLALNNLGISQKEVKQVAVNFVNDSLWTTLPVQFKPHYIAAGSLFLAAKFHSIGLPSENGKAWWHEFDVAPKQLEAVIQQMTELFMKRNPCSMDPAIRPIPAPTPIPTPTQTEKQKIVSTRAPAQTEKQKIVSTRAPTQAEKQLVSTRAPTQTKKQQVVSTRAPTQMEKQQLVSTQSSTQMEKRQIVSTRALTHKEKQQVVSTQTPTRVEKQQVVSTRTPTRVEKQQVVSTRTLTRVEKQQIISTQVPILRHTHSLERIRSIHFDIESSRRVPVDCSTNRNSIGMSARKIDNQALRTQMCQTRTDHSTAVMDVRSEKQSSWAALSANHVCNVHNRPKDINLTRVKNLMTTQKRRIQDYGEYPAPEADKGAWIGRQLRRPEPDNGAWMGRQLRRPEPDNGAWMGRQLGSVIVVKTKSPSWKKQRLI